jgi:hypothetical protein
MADAAVLNTAGSSLPCGFDPHLRHQYLSVKWRLKAPRTMEVGGPIKARMKAFLDVDAVFNGGPGDDAVEGYGLDGTFNGGGGNDSAIVSSGATFSGGGGYDTSICTVPDSILYSVEDQKGC